MHLQPLPRSLRSVAASRRGNTIILDDADQDRTVEVRFHGPHPIPELDAARPRLVLDTYLAAGTGALRPRFTRATIRVR